jgi:hypothetical protein
MYFRDQWVYFAFLINWCAEEAEDAKTVRAYFDAIHHTLSGLRDRLWNHVPQSGHEAPASREER